FLAADLDNQTTRQETCPRRVLFSSGYKDTTRYKCCAFRKIGSQPGATGLVALCAADPARFYFAFTRVYSGNRFIDAAATNLQNQCSLLQHVRRGCPRRRQGQPAELAEVA